MRKSKTTKIVDDIQDWFEVYIGEQLRKYPEYSDAANYFKTYFASRSMCESFINKFKKYINRNMFSLQVRSTDINTDALIISIVYVLKGDKSIRIDDMIIKDDKTCKLENMHISNCKKLIYTDGVEYISPVNKDIRGE